MFEWKTDRSTRMYMNKYMGIMCCINKLLYIRESACAGKGKIVFAHKVGLSQRNQSTLIYTFLSAHWSSKQEASMPKWKGTCCCRLLVVESYSFRFTTWQVLICYGIFVLFLKNSTSSKYKKKGLKRDIWWR